MTLTIAIRYNNVDVMARPSAQSPKKVGIRNQGYFALTG